LLASSLLSASHPVHSEAQKILAEDLPYLPMWFNDVVSVHRRQLGALDLPSTCNYLFLSTLRPGNR
jgi:ABC-type transport system substrate-binding protein